MSSKGQFSDNAVVDLARARVKLRSRAGKATPEFLAGELEAINLLLDQGHSVEARSRLTSLISGATNNPVTLAMARLALSLAMEMHGDYRESLQAVAMYELPEARAKLSDADLERDVRFAGIPEAEGGGADDLADG